MKKLILFSALAALAFAVSFAPLPASASDVFKAALTSSDAGSTNTASMQAGLNYSLQCALEACYKTGTSSSLSADCAQDYVLQPEAACLQTATGTGTSTVAGLDAGPSVQTFSLTFGNARTQCKFQRDFQSGTHTKIVARAIDGGNPGCNLFQILKNP